MCDYSNHIYAGSGCPRCAHQLSKAENDLFTWVKALCPDAIQRDRTIIKPFELDIIVPSLKLAIEYNGMHWHSYAPGDLESSLKEWRKWDKCRAAGYQLFIVWECDWKTKRPVIEHWLRHALNESYTICSAGAAELAWPLSAAASEFYSRYHLQGAPADGQHLGLRIAGEWIGMLTFTKSGRPGEFNLIRLALAGNVPGATSRMFKEMVCVTGAVTVTAHSDNSCCNGNVYKQVGFVRQDEIEPGYRVWHPDYSDDCRHVWDCGKTRWLWTASQG